MPEESQRDRFDDPRTPQEQLAAERDDLQRQLAAGELSQEEYAERMGELLEEEQDRLRARALEREPAPGETEPLDETDA